MSNQGRIVGYGWLLAVVTALLACFPASAVAQGMSSSVVGRLANLPAGAVISWDIGDVTITPSTDTLTFSGASTGYVFNTGPTSTLIPYQAINGTGTITSCMGHVIRVTAAGTVTLPAATTLGQNCRVVSTTAAVISVDPASSSDAITMDQNAAAWAGGNKATSDGTIRAQIYCHNPTANSWMCNSILGVFSDGGA